MVTFAGALEAATRRPERILGQDVRRAVQGDVRGCLGRSRSRGVEERAGQLVAQTEEIYEGKHIYLLPHGSFSAAGACE